MQFAAVLHLMGLLLILFSSSLLAPLAVSPLFTLLGLFTRNFWRN